MRGMAGLGRRGAGRDDARGFPLSPRRCRHALHGGRPRDRYATWRPSSACQTGRSRRFDGMVRVLHPSQSHPGCWFGLAVSPRAGLASGIAAGCRGNAERIPCTSPQRTSPWAAGSRKRLTTAWVVMRRPAGRRLQVHRHAAHRPSRMRTHVLAAALSSNALSRDGRAIHRNFTLCVLRTRFLCLRRFHSPCSSPPSPWRRAAPRLRPRLQNR